MANFPETFGLLDERGLAPCPPLVAGSARILLAEDHAIVGELIVMMGRRLGLSIAWVDNGMDAVTAVLAARNAGKPYSLLLLDAMMPILDGVEAARRVRGADITEAELPIVAVSAATASHEVKAYLAAGMQAYLPKPVTLKALEAVIAAWAPHLVHAKQTDPDRPSHALIGRYRLRKKDLHDRIAALCEGEIATEETVSELRQMLHKLAGTAGSFGEDQLSILAAEHEARLGQCRPDELCGVLSSFQDALV